MNDIFLLSSNEESDVFLLNNVTEKCGLTLTREEAKELVNFKNNVLKDNNLIEVESVLLKIVKTFYDSPYVSEEDYLTFLEDITSIFYFARTCVSGVSDIELLNFLRDKFDNCCYGIIMLLCYYLMGIYE